MAKKQKEIFIVADGEMKFGYCGEIDIFENEGDAMEFAKMTLDKDDDEAPLPMLVYKAVPIARVIVVKQVKELQVVRL